MQHKDENYSQLNDKIKDLQKKITEVKRANDGSGYTGLSQLDERRMLKKFEDKINN